MVFLTITQSRFTIVVLDGVLEHLLLLCLHLSISLFLSNTSYIRVKVESPWKALYQLKNPFTRPRLRQGSCCVEKKSTIATLMRGYLLVLWANQWFFIYLASLSIACLRTPCLQKMPNYFFTVWLLCVGRGKRRSLFLLRWFVTSFLQLWLLQGQLWGCLCHWPRVMSARIHCCFLSPQNTDKIHVCSISRFSYKIFQLSRAIFPVTMQ